MHDVNLWLVAGSFVLGLLLTLPLMIGRVTTEDQRDDS
jgi:ABC-type arginine/histidine transport system permease subunit